jgi:hypothetical protein
MKGRGPRRAGISLRSTEDGGNAKCKILIEKNSTKVEIL